MNALLFTLDKERNPVPSTDIVEWMEWMNTHDRTVNYSTLSDGSTVSTVFLGINHSFMNSPPVLFETMSFGPPPKLKAKVRRRYATWVEAERGHKDILNKLWRVE